MSSAKVLLAQSLGFVTIIALSWFDELVGLRSLILGDHPYISDFKESTLEMLIVLTVWLLVFGSTRRMFNHMRYLEGFMRVCSWCHRIKCDGRWVPLEELLFKNFETRPSHGICEGCRQKLESAIEQVEHGAP